MTYRIPTAIFIASWPTLVSCRLPGLRLKRVTDTSQDSVFTLLSTVVIYLFVHTTLHRGVAITAPHFDQSEAATYSCPCFSFIFLTVCSSLSSCLSPSGIITLTFPSRGLIRDAVFASVFFPSCFVSLSRSPRVPSRSPFRCHSFPPSPYHFDRRCRISPCA
ncbi:hypothetical protein H4582DRAFT_2030930 [Lactarius indigo]|nr:hypothetical protein H4582DRAFT_2030930 [Lactarius indigo]